MNTALLLMGVVFCLALSQAKAARDVKIGSSATSGGSFTGGTFTPTADNATVSAADVSTMLDAGVSVTITTGDTGAQAGSITMTAPVTQFGSFGSSLTLSAAGSITLNAISLGFAGGALTVSGFGAITQTGGLTISGNATFTTASGAIMLTQGNQLSGSVSLNTGANDVWLSNNRGLVLGHSTVGGSLTIDANGPVTQTGALTVPGTASFSAGANSITLNNPNNSFFGAVSFNNGANDIVIANNRPLLLSFATIGGNLTVNTQGAIGQSGSLTVFGASTFSAGANAITLNQANALFGSVSLNNFGANDVSLVNNAALVFGPSAIGRNLTVSASGAINQTAGVSVGGTASFSAGANPITLNQGNTFLGNVSLNNSGPNDVFIANNVGLMLGASTIGRNLTVNTAGAVSQTGGLTVFGASTFSAGANAITLSQANAFLGSVIFNNSGPNDVSIMNNAPLVLGPSTVGGSLTINAGGPITQTGALTVPGAASFSAGANPVTLSQANNSFVGAVSFSNNGANDISIANNRALVLSSATVGGNLTVNTQGAIAQSGALTVFGNSTFFAGPNVITLNQANALLGRVSLNNFGPNDVSLVNIPPLVLGASTIGQNLTVTVAGSGPLIQNGTIQSGGSGTFTAGSIRLNGNVTASGSLTLVGPTILDADSLLNAASITLQSVLAGNGHALTATGFTTLSGGTIDSANSRFVFLNSFAIGTDILSIQNWNGAASGGGPSQIFAGNSASGLPAAQLVKVRFVNPASFPPAVHRGMILNNGEIVPAPRPVLQYIRSGRNLVLTWTNPSILQSATTVTGPYADVPSASSPFTNVIGTQPSIFFRLR